MIEKKQTDTTSTNTVKEMKIDEAKQYGLYKLERNIATNENKRVYSDHNSILISLDYETPTEEKRPKKIITKKRYKRYRTSGNVYSHYDRKKTNRYNKHQHS